MALSLYLILSKCDVIKLLLIILKPLVLDGDKTKFKTGAFSFPHTVSWTFITQGFLVPL